MGVYIEDFYKVTDGIDWLPAFYRAQTLLSQPTVCGGFSLCFRARSYYFSDTLNVLCPLSLIGSGGAIHPGTILMFPKGKKGIIFHGQATNLYAEYGGNPQLGGGSAQGAIIEKIGILAVDPVDQSNSITHAMLDFSESCIFPNPGAHGVVLYTQATLRDVAISGFDGHGIYIFGNGENDIKHLDDEGNPIVRCITAFSQLQNLFVYSNGGDGLHTYGGDCSGIVVTSCQFNGHAGWGVCDLNYLGQGTYTSGQFSYNVFGGVARPYNVFNRDYGHLEQILALEQINARANQDPLVRQNRSVLIAALPAILAANPEPTASAFPLLTLNLASYSENVSYRKECQDYRNAWDTYAKTIGDQLQIALNPEFFEPDVHLDYVNPHTGGGSLFINVYAEGNYNADTGDEHNLLAANNMCINSDPRIMNLTDTLGWSAKGSRNTILGNSGLDSKILESDALVLRSGMVARSITYSDTKPISNEPAGTLVFNNNPAPGSFVGWISLGSGNWHDFGLIP